MPWTIGTFKTLARTWINHASKGAWPHTSLWCKALLFALWGPLQVLCLKKAFSCCLPWWNCSQSSYLYNLFCFSLWLVLSFANQMRVFEGMCLCELVSKCKGQRGVQLLIERGGGVWSNCPHDQIGLKKEPRMGHERVWSAPKLTRQHPKWSPQPTLESIPQATHKKMIKQSKQNKDPSLPLPITCNIAMPT